MSLYDLDAPTISNLLAKFGGHRHCGSGDTLFLIWQRISLDYMLKSLCEFMGGMPLTESHHPTTFGCHRNCGSGDMLKSNKFSY